MIGAYLPVVWLTGCFFCGVDSKYLIYFAGVFVASMVLATVSFFVWSCGKKGVSSEDVKYSIFEDEEPHK